jgi:hypothetical protein
MPTTTPRSLRLGYKYLWDDSQWDRNVWNEIYLSDYKFLTPQGRSGIQTGRRQFRGQGGPVGRNVDRGGTAATFNLQPRMHNVAAQQKVDEAKAKEYRRKRLFSWSLYHHPDDTADM